MLLSLSRQPSKSGQEYGLSTVSAFENMTYGFGIGQVHCNPPAR